MFTNALSAVRAQGQLPLAVDFSDGSTSHFSLIWLLDNDPSGFHSQTGERAFDLLSVPGEPELQSASIQPNGELALRWTHGETPSHFSPDWLFAHRPGQHRTDPADLVPTPWASGQDAQAVPRHKAKDILNSDEALLAWLQDTKRHGLTLVQGIEGQGEASMAIAKRIGFLRETNFGQTFEVVNRPDPNNLAYTALALALHTDLTNQEVPPGYQFLHCISNEAKGGGSVFADGFAIAQRLREQDPEAFDTLANTPIPCRFFDKECDIRNRQPVITLDRAMAVEEIRFNAHLVDLIDLPLETVEAWYRAYRAFMRLSRDPLWKVSFRMEAGEMVVFDNRRVLHGRESFDPSTGKRHLHGCYVDRVEFDSRIRMLAA